MADPSAWMNLQSTLAAGNPPSSMTTDIPHHPISCREDHIWLDETGRMGCEHAQVPAGDRRTQGCVDQSIAILLIELLAEREASHAR